jgi:hypothetical protein
MSPNFWKKGNLFRAGEWAPQGNTGYHILEKEKNKSDLCEPEGSRGNVSILAKC